VVSPSAKAPREPGALIPACPAGLLHVSRPHLIKLLDQGAIPHHKVGTHRRIRIEDLFAYGKQRDTTRREKLDELTQISEELSGGYR
jgi:excisionase family DNA binding protein